MGPRTRFFELCGQPQEITVCAKSSDKLDAQGQPAVGPMQRHADRRPTGEVGQLRVRHPAQILLNKLIKNPGELQNFSGPQLADDPGPLSAGGSTTRWHQPAVAAWPRWA